MQADRQCLFRIARMDIEGEYRSCFLVLAYKHGRSMVASVRRNEAIQITFKDDRFQTVVVLDCLITVKVLILIHVFQFDVES